MKCETKREMNRAGKRESIPLDGLSDLGLVEGNLLLVIAKDGRWRERDTNLRASLVRVEWIRSSNIKLQRREREREKEKKRKKNVRRCKNERRILRKRKIRRENSSNGWFIARTHLDGAQDVNLVANFNATAAIDMRQDTILDGKRTEII